MWSTAGLRRALLSLAPLLLAGCYRGFEHVATPVEIVAGGTLRILGRNVSSLAEVPSIAWPSRPGTARAELWHHLG